MVGLGSPYFSRKQWIERTGDKGNEHQEQVHQRRSQQDPQPESWLSLAGSMQPMHYDRIEDLASQGWCWGRQVRPLDLPPGQG